jgi:hypothetical protein
MLSHPAFLHDTAAKRADHLRPLYNIFPYIIFMMLFGLIQKKDI